MSDDITAFWDMPDDWGVIAHGFQWIAWGPLTRRQRFIRWLRKLKRC